MLFEAKNYRISYDPDKDYNNHGNFDYIPPYRSKYKSVYDGVEIEIHVVDQCNLNCNCCNHFSPLAKPWFITLESFTNQMELLRKNIPTVRSIILLGGEPTLHPQLFELCKIAREFFPKAAITVISNGTILSDVKKHKQDYLNLNIDFTFTSYYQHTKLDEIAELAPLGLVYNTRLLSKQTLVDITGTGDYKYNFYNCLYHKLPCFTLKDSKIFICPFSAHINIFCNYFHENIPLIAGQDYLELESLAGDLDTLHQFCFTPKNICKYCQREGGACTAGPSKKDRVEFTVPLLDLYVRDYKRYEEIMNYGSVEKMNWALDKNQNPGRVDYDFETKLLNTELIRYGRGKADIIIPYYNETAVQLERLRDNLLSQTVINDCCIYLISDGSYMDLKVLNLFSEFEQLHCVFLRNEKNKGPGAARNKGLDNSYNDLVFFLDVDDTFARPTALEELIKAGQSPDFDLVRFISMNKFKKLSKVLYIVKRKVLQENDLRFKEYYFAEDINLLAQISLSLPNNKIYDYNNLYDNLFIVYNDYEDCKNITSTFADYDILHFSFITATIMPILKALQNISQINQSELKRITQTCYQNLNLLLDDEHEYVYTHPLIRILLGIFIVKTCSFDNSLLRLDTVKNIITKIRIDENDLNKDTIQSAIQYIKQFYLTDLKLKNNANDMIQLLEDLYA